MNSSENSSWPWRYVGRTLQGIPGLINNVFKECQSAALHFICHLNETSSNCSPLAHRKAFCIDHRLPFALIEPLRLVEQGYDKATIHSFHQNRAPPSGELVTRPDRGGRGAGLMRLACTAFNAAAVSDPGHRPGSSHEPGAPCSVSSGAAEPGPRRLARARLPRIARAVAGAGRLAPCRRGRRVASPARATSLARVRHPPGLGRSRTKVIRRLPRPEVGADYGAQSPSLSLRWYRILGAGARGHARSLRGQRARRRRPR
jgi:hypothetical protein